MSPLAWLVALLLALPALAFVLYPLLRSRLVFERAVRMAAPAPAISDEEEAARTALRELEFDYQLGNVAESDYRSLRERYLRRALQAIRQRRTREEQLDALIEERLRLLREEDARRSGDGQ
jgi:hypothetical protein